MANPKVSTNSTTLAMTPYQVFLQQMSSTTGQLYATNNGLNYTPNQLGGIFTQQQIVTNAPVLQTITFSVKSS